MKVCKVSEMRCMDRYAVEKLDIPEEILMENAGLASSFVLESEVGIKDKKFVVFCGIGNNGGDGFVVTRKIHSNGGMVKVYVLGDQEKFQGAAKTNLDIVSKLPIDIRRIASVNNEVRRDLLHCHGIVDAIFGTGLDREVTGLHREVIQFINASNKKVLSLDIPSGVNGDTGEVMGVAVKADSTVTYGLPKVGNMLYPGYGLCGRLYVTHLSFPPSLHNSDDIKVQINDFIVLPGRERDVYKGQMGEVLFIAGASSYFGAPYFSAFSFLKAGGGYVRLAAPASIAPFIAMKGSEIVFVPQKETRSGSLSLENKEKLLELSEKMDMVVIGPGVSLDTETQQLVRELVRAIKKPVLIDGDGISAIANELEMIRERKGETILTPHLGEMSRIAKKSVSDIHKQRVDILQLTAMSLHAIIVLKGAHSLIGYPDERVFINLSGNPGMATAGSGDVLTGTIAAMFGLGLSLEDAVRKGVFIHGFSADLAAADKGEDGITAQDILDYLPAAVKRDREASHEAFRGIYEGPRVV
ncbi:MAG: NAD(P)H-hydrate dehydratase [Deltaproteobacteria bacterium]|nr:NAD(P)H-hydrate dehydratase [Deltaproteobacteria bacterium]